MKLLIAIAIFLSASFVQAYEPPSYAPNVGSYVTNSVYVTSRTAAITFASSMTKLNGTPDYCVISSYPVLFHGVYINRCGYPESSLEIYSTKVGTTATSVNTFTINTATAPTNPIIFDVWLDSGLAIWNKGTPPADITIMYKKK